MRTSHHLSLTLSRCCGVGLLLLACHGCMTAQTYDGEKLERDEVAHISGDPRFTAGLPITVLLRKVDEVTLNAGENAVDVLPGMHTLLVDCRIAETGDISRHSIEMDFYAGRRYRLVAETGAGARECTGVNVEGSD